MSRVAVLKSDFVFDIGVVAGAAGGAVSTVADDPAAGWICKLFENDFAFPTVEPGRRQSDVDFALRVGDEFRRGRGVATKIKEKHLGGGREVENLKPSDLDGD